MAVNILSTQSIINYIQNFIRAKNPTADIQTGSDLYDLIIHGNAQTASRIFEELQNVENLQSIFTTFNEDLDLVARNYNLVRKRPVLSTGNITFFATSLSSDIIISDSSIISTKGTAGLAGITFETVGDYSIIFADRSVYFNPLQGRYEITVPIKSTISGSLANINSNSISVVQSTISEIEGCVNYSPTTGGTDGELDEELQQRCALSWVVSSIGTRDGYTKVLVDRDEVSDAYPVGPFDTDSVRTGQGIDVYCITTSALTDNIQTIQYSNDDYTILTSQPVVNLVNVENLTGGYTAIENVSYNFNKQIDSPFSGSYISNDTTARVDWISTWNGSVNSVITQPNTFVYENTGPDAPIQIYTTDAYKNTRITFTDGLNNGITRTVTSFSYDSEAELATFTTNDFPETIAFGDTFTVNPRPNIDDSIRIQYNHNEDITTLQDYVSQSTRGVIGANILVKNGHKGSLYLTFNIKLFPGYTFTAVRDKVESAISQYISSLKLGDDIQLSDLTVVAQTGQGTDYTIVEVDYVNFDTTSTNTYIDRWNNLEEGFGSDGVISLENREYMTLELITIGQI